MVMAVGVAIVGDVACSGGAEAPGGAHDGGGAGRDGGGAGPDGGDAAQCPPPDGQTAEPSPRHLAVDGGVPLDQLARALAVARCGYFSRCYALSTYLANECVDSLVNYETWAYETCGTAAYIGSFCSWIGPLYTYPSADLLQAVAAGVIHYDAQKEAQCIAALLAEECGGYGLFEELPACLGVFTCASGIDGGASGPTDGGAADGGSACSQLIPSEQQAPAHLRDRPGLRWPRSPPGSGLRRRRLRPLGVWDHLRFLLPVRGGWRVVQLERPQPPERSRAHRARGDLCRRAGLPRPGGRRRARHVCRACRRGRNVHRRRQLQTWAHLRVRHLPDPAQHRRLRERAV